MKILKKLLFTITVLFCFSIAAAAQNQDGKKQQPKKDPPVVPVKEKEKPKEDRPKNEKDDRVKKPEMAFYLSKNQIVINLT